MRALSLRSIGNWKAQRTPTQPSPDRGGLSEGLRLGSKALPLIGALLLMGGSLFLTFSTSWGQEQPQAGAGQEVDFKGLSEVLLEGKDTVARIEAAKKLGATKDPRALDPLLKALKDENKATRWASIESLGDLGNPKAIPHIVPFLNKREAYRWSRRLAINALGAIRDPEAIPPLVPFLKDPDPYVRRVTVFALGKIGNEKAMPQVVELLRDDSMVVRRWVQNALAQMAQEKLQGGEPPRDYQSWVEWVNSQNHRPK